MKVLRGLPAVRGIGVGPARVFMYPPPSFSVWRNIKRGEEEEELRKLERGIDLTKKELIEIKEKVEKKLGNEHAMIIDSHLLILSDKVLIKEIIDRIVQNLESAEKAIEKIIHKYRVLFDQMPDPYMKSKIHDIEDVLRRLQRNLGYPPNKEDEWEEGIVIAHYIMPSEAALLLSTKSIKGFAFEIGGETSHAIILARAFAIPSVIGVEGLMDAVVDGEEVIVDGYEGQVIVSPTKTQVSTYVKKIQAIKEDRKFFEAALNLDSVTLDGKAFRLLANLEFPVEVEEIKKMKAEGVGLFRTEYLVLASESLPGEQQQYSSYLNVAKEIEGEVVIRLFDLGAEKKIPFLTFAEEENPAMGTRGIRYLLRNKNLLYTQLRAILRASAEAPNIKILLPMVSTVDEIKKFYLVLEDVKSTLKKEGFPFNEDIEVGVLIEVPSAALAAEKILKYSDFISIGTNDLTQYLLAADRNNKDVSHLCNPLDPTMLKLLKTVISTAKKAKKKVSVCGEMASHPLHALVLLGLELEDFSVSPKLLPLIKKVLTSVEHAVLVRKVNFALRLSSSEEVTDYLLKEMEKIYPEIASYIRRYL